MIEIFDKSRRRVAIAENAHAISEQERINAVWYFYFSLPYKDPKNEYCKRRVQLSVYPPNRLN